MAASTDIRIITVKSSSERKQFIDFLYKHNSTDPNWVAPLRMVQNQLFAPDYLFWKKNPHHFFLAYQNGKCTGRIAAFVNLQHNIHYKESDGFFGYLEAINDLSVCKALIEAATLFLKENNCRRIIGPMNPDIHNELGVLVNGFGSPPYFMLTHNYSYYDNLIQRQGFTKLQDFYSYMLDESKFIPSAKMDRVAQMLIKKYEIKIRNPDMKKFLKELEHIHVIYNDAFKDHWGFVPIPKDEFLVLAKDMKSIIDPRLVLIAEYKEEPVAFLLCLPNLNEILIRIKNGRLLPAGIFKILFGKKKIKSARVITVAVKQSYQHWGIGALFYPELMKRGLQYGYKKSELSWVAESNAVMNTIARELAGDPYKTYRLYSKRID